MHHARRRHRVGAGKTRLLHFHAPHLVEGEEATSENVQDNTPMCDSYTKTLIFRYDVPFKARIEPCISVSFTRAIQAAHETAPVAVDETLDLVDWPMLLKDDKRQQWS